MKISGFTMVRNATRFYFPVKESILSALPVVDEFIVALGDCETGDKTREEIESIGSDKIKIYDRVWSEEDFVKSRIFAKETNFALSKCTGDWCFYLQADEVIHEKDYDKIKNACTKYLDKKEVDGFLFDYYHFWGDYDHYLPFHGWYKNEIRIIRNNAGIYSRNDAQSFLKNDGEKLNVIPIGANIYHYGWVRPPQMMQSKKKEHDSIHHGKEKISKEYKLLPGEFDYGTLGRIPVFKGTHPKVMEKRISEFFWKDKLNYSKKGKVSRKKFKHEKAKYEILTFIEKYFNGGKEIFGYSNWNKLKNV